MSGWIYGLLLLKVDIKKVQEKVIKLGDLKWASTFFVKHGDAWNPSGLFTILMNLLF